MHVVASVDRVADSNSEWDAPDISHHVESVDAVTEVDPGSKWNSESTRWEDGLNSQGFDHVDEGATEVASEEPDSEWEE